MNTINPTLFPLGNNDPKGRLNFVHIDVTVRCNLKCTYCYYGEFNNKNSQNKEVSLDRLKEVIDEASELGCTRVIFSGGEVFLGDRVWPLVDKCAELGMEMSFITNGTLVNEDVIKKLVSNIDLIHEIKISHDGKNHDDIRGAGSSEKTLRAIDQFCEANLPWTLNTIITKKSIDDLPDIYEYLNKKNPKAWRIDHPFSQGNMLSAKDELEINDFTLIFDLLADILSDYLASDKHFELWMFTIYRPGLEMWDFTKQKGNMHPCTYNKRNLAIRGNGEVTPCSRFLNELGNVKVGTLSETFDTDKFAGFWSIAIDDILQCQGCRYISICGAGCRAHAYYENGSVVTADPIACKIMPLYESKIVPLFSIDTRASFAALVDQKGFVPVAKESLTMP